jgi:hypothetical protein
MSQIGNDRPRREGQLIPPSDAKVLVTSLLNWLNKVAIESKNLDRTTESGCQLETICMLPPYLLIKRDPSWSSISALQKVLVEICRRLYVCWFICKR